MFAALAVAGLRAYSRGVKRLTVVAGPILGDCIFGLTVGPTSTC